MRKIFIHFTLALTALFLVSCEGPMGPAGRDGRDGTDGMDGVCSISNVVIDVEQRHWSYSNLDNNNYYYATVNVPEITKNVCKYGFVKIYRVYDDESQIELPFVRHKEYQIYGSSDWGFYTETVDYEFAPGKITIFYTASDFDYELDESFIPESMQFRCVAAY